MTLTAEQLVERRNAIGASDAAAAVGLSPWITPFELWQDKLGELPALKQNEPMYWGSKLEAIILARYAEEHAVTPEAPCAWRVSKKFPFMGCTPDALLGDRVVEIKTARYDSADWGEPGSEQIPRHYFLQCTHAMIVCERERCDLPVLFGGNDYVEYSMRLDPDIALMLVEREKLFWRHVVEGTPPEVMSLTDAAARWPRDIEEKVIATAEVEAAVAKLHELRAREVEVEQEAERVGVEIRKHMGFASALVSETGRTLATWKTQTRNQFDVTTFKRAHPELHAQFCDKRESRFFRLGAA